MNSNRASIKTNCVNPSYVAWRISQAIAQGAQKILIITPTYEDTLKLESALAALLSNKFVVSSLEPIDESPYSSLPPSSRSIFYRLAFLWRAYSSSSPGVFIADGPSLSHHTIPVEDFVSASFTLCPGDTIDIDSICLKLVHMGYQSSPIVEDVGTFSRRGSIIDIFCSSEQNPVRIELFGDQIESIRSFDAETQRSEASLTKFDVTPAREVLIDPEHLTIGKGNLKTFFDEVGLGKAARDSLLDPLEQGIFSNAIDIWASCFYKTSATPIDYFSAFPVTIFYDPENIAGAIEEHLAEYKTAFEAKIAKGESVPHYSMCFDPSVIAKVSAHYIFQRLSTSDDGASAEAIDIPEFAAQVGAARQTGKDYLLPALESFSKWKNSGHTIVVFISTATLVERATYLFKSHGLSTKLSTAPESDWSEWQVEQKQNPQLIHIIQANLPKSVLVLKPKLVFIRDEDIFGAKTGSELRPSKEKFLEKIDVAGFGDLAIGNYIVHAQHGIGLYDGLKKITVNDVPNEFLVISFRDNDKLYVPIYRLAQVHKYVGPEGSVVIDKLGGTSWQKAKVKVKNALKDLAAELLDLYAKRAQAKGFTFSKPDDEFREFEAAFPYNETRDQAKAINDVISDMTNDKPMDRLVCGDVGFGKTEVAVRAAFKAVQDKKQVVVMAPTTILAFQHFNTFSKRFSSSAISVGLFSRFTPPAKLKSNISALAEGKLDIAVGTHRLLSKDIKFRDLGLLVIDEEQRFGVTQKERIKKFRANIDVLALSATPIPRSLNMSLMGIRDLSLINTPPENRLSIRTFISKFDIDNIRRAVLSEIQRGGQVYIIHNRVQSIYGLTDELRAAIPEAKIRVAHGQMEDGELESTMVEFFNHEFDVLVCTTIIENGVDIPLANTIIIDRADTFGLAQLYQLRGRVGRSKVRGYAHLLLPVKGAIDQEAQERLRILQENSALGSGFRIAHHDLELRGSGNILGTDQSGHISAVGYELFMELLEQALNSAKGSPVEESLEPEINLRIQALIPDSYIADIRMRLDYYKRLASINNEAELDLLEAELADRFGPIPEPVSNLFGVMYVRRLCKNLDIKDISASPQYLTLSFIENPKVRLEGIVKLTTSQPQKYRATPDNKLVIKMPSPNWAPVVEELRGLSRLLL